MVKFCEKCGNLYNHSIDESNQFIYKCITCGNIDNVIEHCIVVNELNQNAHDYPVNPNIIYDNTLPRTNKIICPNPDCPSHSLKQNPEVVIYQYNPDMLNVGYMCTLCRNYWKN